MPRVAGVAAAADATGRGEAVTATTLQSRSGSCLAPRGPSGEGDGLLDGDVADGVVGVVAVDAPVAGRGGVDHLAVPVEVLGLVAGA